MKQWRRLMVWKTSKGINKKYFNTISTKISLTMLKILNDKKKKSNSKWSNSKENNNKDKKITNDNKLTYFKFKKNIVNFLVSISLNLRKSNLKQEKTQKNLQHLTNIQTVKNQQMNKITPQVSKLKLSQINLMI